MELIPINIATEDVLSESLVEVLLNQSGRFIRATRYPGRGFGNLKKNIAGFNKASKGIPWLVLTDLDESLPCASLKIKQWLPHGKNHNLLFRVAVREVESWIMADREDFASYLCISPKMIPNPTDETRNAKEFLLSLVRKCRSERLKRALLPASGSLASIGPGYNSILGEYILTRWSAERAAESSVSLRKALACINNFEMLVE